ncbi:hypothetical protein [Flavobacterium sp.]|uniref:hypothetical protein n=1 Tax=Flavobacterium sp. TaxID=239 RepID=UPI003C3FD630
MKEKKNIDRLFQEQLKDFEATPNNQIWLNIEAELKKDKKKRRIIPLWFQYSGIAGALILGLFIMKTGFQKEVLPTNTSVVKSQDTNQSRSIDNETSIKKDVKIIEEEAMVIKEIIPSKKNSKQNNLRSISQKYKEKNTYSFTKKENIQEIKNNPIVHQQASQLAENKSTNKQSLGNSVLEDNNNTTILDPKIASSDTKKTITNTKEETNDLEDILKTKTEKKTEIASVSKSRWLITPNIAPVYLNTSSGGSAIDNQFSNNEKVAETGLSYGLGIHYAINSKIAIRTGINKVVLGYNTNNIDYAPGLTTNSIATIDYLPSNAIEIRNKASFSALNSTEKNIQKNTTGAINQQMGYYEFPLEISYSLLDKKFGISIIGGFSSLFLDENKIYLVSSQSNVELGEANNLNKIHLSSNFGIGFKYQLIPSIQLNFEPTIKYQMNTFTSQSNNFKPFFIGLYSGISYRF